MNSSLLHLPDTGTKKQKVLGSHLQNGAVHTGIQPDGGGASSLCTLIWSSRAVRREMRCVRPGFVTPCCPSFEMLLICTICWASSSQRLRSSVGWSAGTIPWSGASWRDAAEIQIHYTRPLATPPPTGSWPFRHTRTGCVFPLTSQQYCWTSWSTLLRSLFSDSSSRTVVAYRLWKSKSIDIEYDF